jgi:RNA polymerase sigma factor (sigma-70 family)
MTSLVSNLAAPAGWHAPLYSLLPLVRTTASRAFRHLHPSERDDAIQDVVADTTAEFARLASNGRPHFWLIPPLARYAVRRRAAGRRVGTSSNKRDVLSPVPRGEAGVYSLDEMEGCSPQSWRAAVADSRQTDPAEAACFRVDFEEWLSSLPHRHREVASAFVEGDTTGELASRLGVSPGRVSQLRAELKASWLAFQGELEPGLAAA